MVYNIQIICLAEFVCPRTVVSSKHVTSFVFLPLENFNPLNVELNPICHQLVLLGAQHILHVSGIRVKSTANLMTIRNIVDKTILYYS